VGVDRHEEGREEDQELRVLVRGVAGLEQVRPVSVESDQLLCLPEPLMPA